MVTSGPRVLVVLGVGAAVEPIRSLLEASGCQVVAHATSGGDAVRQVAGVAPDVILISWDLPDMPGLDALRVLRSSAAGAQIVIFSMVPQPGGAARALAEGANDYVEIADTRALVARVTPARRPNDPPGMSRCQNDGDQFPVPVNDEQRVLVVDPDPAARAPLRRALERKGGTVTEAASLAEAEMLLRQPFDAIVTNRWLPDGDGLGLLASVSTRTPDVRVVVRSDVAEGLGHAWVIDILRANTGGVIGADGFGSDGRDLMAVLNTSAAELMNRWEAEGRKEHLASHPIVAQTLIDGLQAASFGTRREIEEQVVRDVITVMPEAAPTETALEELNCLREVLTSQMDTRASASAVIDVMARANGLIDAAELALLARDLERLRTEADTDPLTGLLNRRAF